MWVEDLERGVMNKANPYPWQTDTSIGDWFYNKNWQFRDINWVVHMLIDIVSKNGNLLLNVVQHPDGSLDPEVEQLLAQMADWMSTNSEGIYGSRPWITFGEGSTSGRTGSFNEEFKPTASDIRFTTKKGAVYAYAMGWPESREVRITSMPKTSGSGKVSDVQLLGYNGKLTWVQDENGLKVTLPDQKISSVAICLKVTGTNLNKFPSVAPTSSTMEPDKAGNINLPVDRAELHGNGVKTERKNEHDNLGFWDNAGDWVSWNIKVPAAGVYDITFQYASIAPSSIKVEVNKKVFKTALAATGAFETFQPGNAGKVTFTKAGKYVISFKPDEANWKAINLADITLKLSQ